MSGFGDAPEAKWLGEVEGDRSLLLGSSSFAAGCLSDQLMSECRCGNLNTDFTVSYGNWKT